MVVPCPQCGKKLKARDGLAGRSARCACGTVFTVPAAKEAVRVREAPRVLLDTAPVTDEVGTRVDLEATPAPDGSAAKSSETSIALEGLRECLPVALRSMAVSVLVASCLVVPAVYLLRSVTSAAEEFVPVAVFDIRLALAPAILSAMFGALFGFLAGSRMVNKSGLVGLPACVLGLLGVAALVLAAIIAASLFFAGPMPSVFWFCLFCMGGMAAVGACFYGLFGG
jgi:hypothetical protein